MNIPAVFIIYYDHSGTMVGSVSAQYNRLEKGRYQQNLYLFVVV